MPQITVLRRQILHGPLEGIRCQHSQRVILLNTGLGGSHVKIRGGEDLVIGHAITVKVLLPYHGLPLLHHIGNGGVILDGLINGDETVIGEPQAPITDTLQSDGAQVFRVLVRGNDIGIIHHNGFVQFGMGVPGDDHIDTGNVFGKDLILALFRVRIRTAVGQADDKLRPLGFQRSNTALGGDSRVFQGEA